MMDYILQNMQYRYMENVIQQINRGAVQNVTKPSLSGTGFAHIFQQTQMAESGISAGDLDAIFEEASRTYGVPADLLKAVGKTVGSGGAGRHAAYAGDGAKSRRDGSV